MFPYRLSSVNSTRRQPRSTIARTFRRTSTGSRAQRVDQDVLQPVGQFGKAVDDPRRVPLLDGFRSAVFLPNRDWPCIHGTITSTSNTEEHC
jgi:hypothetical protein